MTLAGFIQLILVLAVMGGAAYGVYKFAKKHGDL